MKKITDKYLIKIIAILIVIICYFFTVPRIFNPKEKEKLLAEFSFEKSTLYKPSGEAKFIRNVHPQYEHISAWISSVGAAVAIDDIDNDGRSNDIVHVDPRFDKILVSSLENSFLPFVLEVSSLKYDSETMAPMGALTNDFNEDGLTDILVYYWGRTPVIFLKGEKGYMEMELVENGGRWFTNAATLADFDGDGSADILITNYFPDGARILDKGALDHDQVMQHSMSRAYNGGDNHFFLYVEKIGDKPVYKEDLEWNEDIENIKDWTLAVAAVDFTGDLLPEVYFANDFGPDKFLLNQSSPGKLNFKLLKGERKFTTISSSVLGKDSFKGMGVGIGDLNSDGLLDIYVSNIADEFALLESHFVFLNTGEIENYDKGIAPFFNESEKLGLSRSSWGWDSKVGDFNNDGTLEAIQATGFLKGTTDRWPELQELAIGNDELLAEASLWPKFQSGDELSGHAHNPFFVQDHSGKFFDIALDIGIGQSHVSRGIALGDVDYDGDLDFVVANQWEDSHYFQNTNKVDNGFIGLKICFSVNITVDKLLINPKQIIKVRPAIGAIVNIYKDDQLIQTSFVDGGNGHSGSNSKDVFFGLKNYLKEEIDVEILYVNKEGERKQEKFKLNNGWSTIILPI